MATQKKRGLQQPRTLKSKGGQSAPDRHFEISRHLVEQLGCIIYQVQGTDHPFPTPGSTEFQAWVDETLRALQNRQPGLLGWTWDELWHTIENTATSAATAAERLEGSIAKTARDAASGVISDVDNLLLNPMKTAISEIFNKASGPLRDWLSSGLQLMNLVKTLESTVLNTEKRIEYVGRTLLFLFPMAVWADLTNALKDLTSGDEKEFEDNLERLFIVLLMDLNPALGIPAWIIDCALHRKILLPTSPIGFAPGRLYDFLRYQKAGHAKGAKPDLSQEEREFRIELLSAIDRYFHDRLGKPQSTEKNNPEAVDGKLSIQTITDLIRVIIQTTFGFVFRPTHLPSRIAPVMSLLRPPNSQPQSTASQASTTISRTISKPISGLSGLVTRGFWEVNTYNESLVEVVSTGIGGTIGSIIDSILYGLLSLLELREVYAEDKDNPYYVYSWETNAWQSDSSITIFQEVIISATVPDKVRKDLAKDLRDLINTKSPSNVLTDLLKDYGTYRELAMVCDEPDLKDSSINVTAQRTDNKLSVTAKSKKSSQETAPSVFRAYVGGKMSLMNPPTAGNQSYTLVLNLDSTFEGDVNVVAGLSSHGCCKIPQ